MSNLFNKIDSIDLTSILTENEEAIQDELNKQYSGQWESNEKLSENDLQIESILKEIGDSLAIMNESITNLDIEEATKLVEEALDRVAPRWSIKLRESILVKLGFTRDVKKSKKTLKENDINDINDIDAIQKEISDLKAGIENIDKLEDVSDESTFEVNGNEYTKLTANIRIDLLSKELEKLAKDKNDDLDTAFGETKITEEAESTKTFSQWFDEWYPETHEIDEPEDEFYPFDNYVKAFPNAECLRNATAKEIASHVGDFDSIYPVDTADREHAFKFACSELGVEYEDLRNKWLNGESINESIATNTTVDNIDQESRDKATIDKAIEIAGDKDTIDNDTFRDLRLKLANKDYDVLDRLKDYALVRGEDVIYTWLRAEDSEDNMTESVHVNITNDSVDVSTDDTNVAVDGNDVDVHVGENPTAPVEVIPDETAPEVLDEPSTEEILDPTSNEKPLDDSEKLNETVEDVLSQAGVSKEEFDEALSNQFPDFESYVLDTEANRFDLIMNGQAVSYNMVLTDNAIEIYPEGGNTSDEDVISLISLNVNESENLKKDKKDHKCLNEKEWKQLESGAALRQAIKDCGEDEEDIDKLHNVLDKLKQCCEDAKAMCDDEYHVDGFQSVIDDIETIYDDEELSFSNVDWELDGFYDWCDAANIFVSLQEDGMQVDDIPAKVDQKKRIELAKLESEEGKISYRVSYLKEDDEEIAGWDIDVDNDEDAIASLDKFSDADTIVDDLMNAQFVETGIEGISSLNYKNTNILLSTDGDENIITISQDGTDPVILKGESFDDVLNQLIYWFIVNTETSEEEPEEATSDEREPENEQE